MENQEANAPIELPKPISAPELTPLVQIEKTTQQPETGRQPQEGASQNAGQPLMPLPAHIADPATSVSASQASAYSPQSQTNNPIIADDVDLIEKEWVSKAKQIVSKTRQDPYAQNKELTVFKADYMKKRYGKQIELAGD